MINRSFDSPPCAKSSRGDTVPITARPVPARHTASKNVLLLTDPAALCISIVLAVRLEIIVSRYEV